MSTSRKSILRSSSSILHESMSSIEKEVVGSSSSSISSTKSLNASVRFDSIKIRQYSIEVVYDDDINDDYDDGSHSDIRTTTSDPSNVKKEDTNPQISLGWDYLEFSDAIPIDEFEYFRDGYRRAGSELMVPVRERKKIAKQLKRMENEVERLERRKERWNNRKRKLLSRLKKKDSLCDDAETT